MTNSSFWARRGRDLRAARVVHLPLLAGPRLAGVPYDAAGFLLADPSDATVDGDDAVFAIGDGAAGECLVSDQCLWWPPTTVASRWLTPWLAARDSEARMARPRVLPSGGISRGSIAGPRAGAA